MKLNETNPGSPADLVLEFLKTQKSNQLSNLEAWLQATIRARGLSKKEPFSILLDSQKGGPALMPYVWDLVLKGVIVPGVGLSNPNFPFYQVTSYGKKVIEEDWFTIHDSGQFISSLVERYGDPGKVAKIFLDECLNAFNKGLYRASVMMLGVATEEIMVMVMTVFLDRVLKGAEKTKFEKLLHSKKLGIAAKTDEFSKRLLPKLELLRGDLRDGLETDLNGMAAIIRRARNDVGHPKEIYVERDEAAGLIQMFPPYWRKSAALMNLWTKKP